LPTTAEPSAAFHVEGGTLRLEGDLGFATVGGIVDAGRAAIAATTASRLVLDLGAVEKSDSAGVALILDWMRAAKARQVEVEVRGVPAQLALIARLGGLASLIGLPESGDAA